MYSRSIASFISASQLTVMTEGKGNIKVAYVRVTEYIFDNKTAGT